MSENNNNYEIGRHDPEREREIRQLNEQIIRNNPGLAKLDERIIYDKAFMLEAQAMGYDVFDKEDIANFVAKIPPKNQERNIIACGADKYKYLGQGEYEEDDLKKFQKKHGANISVKKKEDVYLTDYNAGSRERELLLEKTGNIDMDLSGIDLSDEPKTNYNINEQEDILRKNMARVFGSDKIEVKKEEVPMSNQLVQTNDNVSKTLELIKELKALGFTPEEIKKELQLRYR